VDERPPLPSKGSPWSVYLRPYWLSILLNNNKLLFGFLITFWYLAQFIGAVATINLYSDKDRLMPCDVTGSLAVPEEASKVFDLPLVLLAIFHMIEWVRATFLLTVTCIGVNWVIVWYVTVPNTLYGIITYAFVHMAYFDEDGKKCAEVQESRGTWLLVEIIAFWVVFFLFAFPFIWLLCMGKDRADVQLVKAYEKGDKSDEDDD
jgi:hypothetical protein